MSQEKFTWEEKKAYDKVHRILNEDAGEPEAPKEIKLSDTDAKKAIKDAVARGLMY